MGAQHHYVSKFHLRQFLDPELLSQKDPWLWQGFVPDGPVKRRAPQNVGTRPLMFDGPGGLADRKNPVWRASSQMKSKAPPLRRCERYACDHAEAVAPCRPR